MTEAILELHDQLGSKLKTLTVDHGKEFANYQAIEEISDQELVEINWYMNSRPLKCLNWKSPIKVFIQKMFK